MSIKLNNVALIQGVFRPDFFTFLKKSKKNIVVLEGRPSLQAARENCLQLQKIGITPTLMADNMAGYLFSKGIVKEVWIASQATDKNGAMCDIGALIVAVLAKNIIFQFLRILREEPVSLWANPVICKNLMVRVL